MLRQQVVAFIQLARESEDCGAAPPPRKAYPQVHLLFEINGDTLALCFTRNRKTVCKDWSPL